MPSGQVGAAQRDQAHPASPSPGQQASQEPHWHQTLAPHFVAKAWRSHKHTHTHTDTHKHKHMEVGSPLYLQRRVCVSLPLPHCPCLILREPWPTPRLFCQPRTRGKEIAEIILLLGQIESSHFANPHDTTVLTRSRAWVVAATTRRPNH